MKVGDTFSKDGQTWIWSICPECLFERAVRKRGPLPQRLCTECAKKVSNRVNNNIWFNLKTKGE